MTSEQWIKCSERLPSDDETDDCKDCLKLIDERDRAEDWADDLANDIAQLLGQEIGEHSSGNCPWGNAHDAAGYELDKRARAAEKANEVVGRDLLHGGVAILRKPSCRCPARPGEACPLTAAECEARAAQKTDAYTLDPKRPKCPQCGMYAPDPGFPCGCCGRLGDPRTPANE